MDKKIIDSLLEELKLVSRETYDFLINNKISKEQIAKNYNAISKLIDEKKEKSSTIELSFNDEGDLKWFFKLPDQEQEKEKVRSHLKYFIELSYPYNKINLDLNTDVERNSGRKAILTYMKMMIDNISNSRGFWLYGKFGVGKTHIGICITNYFAKVLKKSVAHINLSEFLTRMKESFEHKTTNQIINSLKNVDFLLIDDVGAEFLTEWSRDEFFLPILNFRMEKKLITCFTSNLTINEYGELLMNKWKNQKDEFIKVDRLLERIRSLSEEIELFGDNKRQ